MSSLLVSLAGLLIVLAGLALMLGLKEQAGWLLRAMLALVVGSALLRYFTVSTVASAQTAEFSTGDGWSVLGIGALALVGFLSWRTRHGKLSRASGRPQSRQSALPPAPVPEDAS